MTLFSPARSSAPSCLYLVSWLLQHLAQFHILHFFELSPAFNVLSAWPTAIVASLWIANHAVRLVRLHFSTLFEERATAELLNTQDLRPAVIASFGLALATGVLAFCGAFAYAALAALAAVLLARYLFFVSVVPLNMALTFTRGGSH